MGGLKVEMWDMLLPKGKFILFGFVSESRMFYITDRVKELIKFKGETPVK